jgi:gamma-glutamylcyclotransferase (GGCT)/AIG2-like uncharacterized protein YtfP
MAEKVTKVFVYGTLKRGGFYNRVLEGSTFIDVAETKDNLALFDLGAYPAVVLGLPSNTPVRGEVFEINEETFLELDRIEGYPYFYSRTPIPVILDETGAEVDVWIYFLLQDKLNPNRARQIETGEWFPNYRELKAS